MYLNVVQLAESFGVTEGVVEGWIRDEGLPCVRDRGRMLFDRRQVVGWAAERGLAAKAGFLAPADAHVGGRLERWLRAGGIWRDVPAAEVHRVFGRVIAALPGASPAVRQMLAQRVQAPEGIAWAPVGGGLALPHLRAHAALGRDAGVLAVILVRDGILPEEDPPPDGVPLGRLIFFVAPSPRAHLEILSRLSLALTRGGLKDALATGAADAAIFAAMALTDQQAGEKENGA